MSNWFAKINENDEYFGDEIYLDVQGGMTGFEVILSTGDTADVMPGMTREEAIENMVEYYGAYETFEWLEDL